MIAPVWTLIMHSFCIQKCTGNLLFLLTSLAWVVYMRWNLLTRPRICSCVEQFKESAKQVFFPPPCRCRLIQFNACCCMNIYHSSFAGKQQKSPDIKLSCFWVGLFIFLTNLPLKQVAQKIKMLVNVSEPTTTKCA